MTRGYRGDGRGGRRRRNGAGGRGARPPGARTPPGRGSPATGGAAELGPLAGRVGAQRLEAVGAIAGGVAHDLNNVLAVVAGYAENAVRELDEQDPLWADMREVLGACRRGAALTRQLLAFARRPFTEPVPLAPNVVIRDLEKLLRRVVGEHIALELRLAPDCGTVMADPAQLEHVLVTLVVSARQGLSGPGVVAVETRNDELDEAAAGRSPGARPGPHVVLVVSSRGAAGGTAAPPEAPARGAGTGAAGEDPGISTVREVARDRGGHVAVEARGGGTQVAVWLPRTAAEGAEDGAPFAMGEGTILVVEDDAALRAVTARTLQRAGYRVLAAASGEEALAAARGHVARIDLLLADVVMPGMSGPEVARGLAATHPEASVLFTSGYVDDPAALRDVLVSRANFLAKPYTLGALLRKAWEVVGASRGAPGPS